MKAKKFWFKMAQQAIFRAQNNLSGVDPQITKYEKYFVPLARQAARYFNVASYCLTRYTKAK